MNNEELYILGLQWFEFLLHGLQSMLHDDRKKVEMKAVKTVTMKFFRLSGVGTLINFIFLFFKGLYIQLFF